MSLEPKKLIPVCIRMPEELLAHIDWAVRRFAVPMDRSKFITTALKRELGGQLAVHRYYEVLEQHPAFQSIKLFVGKKPKKRITKRQLLYKKGLRVV